MEIIYGIAMGIIGILLIILIRLSTTLFHELGHALPALLFTQKTVKVYVGSYGDIANTFVLVLGRLKLYLKINVFDWKVGMCAYEAPALANWKTVVILLGGPIASLLVSLPLIFNYRLLEANPFATFVSIIFIGSAAYDFVANMIPSGTPIRMHDGGTGYSDGYLLVGMLMRKFASADYLRLEEKFLQGEFAAVITDGKEIMTRDPKQRFAYDLVIEAMLKTDDPNGALDTYSKLIQHFKLEQGDYVSIGKIYKQLGNDEEALKYFKAYCYKNYLDDAILHEIGTLQIHLGQNTEAIRTFDNLLTINAADTVARCHRSLALINEGEFDLARADLALVKNEDDQNPNLYFNLGLLAEQANDFATALQHYEKAKSLACDRHGLDFRIELMKGKLKGNEPRI